MNAMQTAIACFKENVEFIHPPLSNPQAYNLNNGLLHLAEALAQAHAQHSRELAALKQQVEQLTLQSRR